MTQSKIMKAYYAMHRMQLKRVPVLPGLIKRYIRLVFSAEIPATCELAEGVQLVHGGLAVVIHDHAVVGPRTKIYPGVVLGGRHGRGAPVIGADVFIGVGAKILGGITIGDGAEIGANAVVITDVPAGALAVGIPATIKLRPQEAS